MIRVHPGRLLARELAARDMSANALALKMRVPANRITEIINGKRDISPETALRLGKAFGTGANFWNRMQADFNLQEMEKSVGAKIEREVEALDS